VQVWICLPAEYLGVLVVVFIRRGEGQEESFNYGDDVAGSVPTAKGHLCRQILVANHVLNILVHLYGKHLLRLMRTHTYPVLMFTFTGSELNAVYTLVLLEQTEGLHSHQLF